jgi:triosephosphate isomerase (TIM)
MYKNQAESLAFVEEFKSEVENIHDNQEALLCPPFTSLVRSPIADRVG